MLLGLNDNFGALLQDEVEEDDAESDYYQHPRIYDCDEDYDGSRVEKALNCYQ